MSLTFWLYEKFQKFRKIGDNRLKIFQLANAKHNFSP